MKITINTRDIHDAIKKAVKLIPKKSTYKPIENLFMEAKNNVITALATDFDSWLVFDIEGNVMEEGSVLLDIETLKLISKLKTNQVTIDNNKIISDNKQIEISNSIDLDENPYPTYDFINDRCNIHGFTTLEQNLSNLFAIKYASSYDQYRPELCSVMIDKEYVFTSDTFRIVRRDINFENNLKEGVVVPIYDVNLLDSFLNKKGRVNRGVNCFVDREQEYILFQVDNMKFCARQIKESYPNNIDKIIPKDFNSSITVNYKQLKEELDFIGSLKEDSIFVEFAQIENGFSMKTINTDKKVEVNLESDVKNEFPSFVLTYKFVKEAVNNNVNGDNIRIDIKDNRSIVKIGNDFIMPVRV